MPALVRAFPLLNGKKSSSTVREGIQLIVKMSCRTQFRHRHIPLTFVPRTLFRGMLFCIKKGSAMRSLLCKCVAGSFAADRPEGPLSTSYFLLDKSFCVESNEEFFVCCNDDCLRRAVLRDEVVGFLAALEVAFFVNLVTEDF